MSNPQKQAILEFLRRRFGEVSKIGSGSSLYSIGKEAARIYFRYSRIHGDARTFFGLRSIDLRELEGHNGYICFVTDTDSPPVVLPFADFEELFRDAQPASDGQYKVQLNFTRGPLELYIPRQGHFNVEGYVGFEALRESLDAAKLKPHADFTHAQVQTLLAEIGQLKGYDVFVPANDVGRLQWSEPGRFNIRSNIPNDLRKLGSLINEIDVVWIASNRDAIEGMFEVEHTTTIYSALLRFNDVLIAEPTVSRFSIVADEGRRSIFARQLYRPTFRKSGLSELTSFLEYANVANWHRRVRESVSGAAKATSAVEL